MTFGSSATDTQTACDTYTWIDGNNYTASDSSAVFTLVNSAGCDSIVTLDLTINSVSEITTSSTATTITANNAVASYLWLDCDANFSAIPNETEQSFTPFASGNYAVALTEGACTDTSECVAISAIGIIEHNFPVEPRLFPNPSSGAFTIDLGGEYVAGSIAVFDASGRLIESNAIRNQRFVSMSITDAGGIYTIQIVASKQHALIRLLTH